MKNSKIISIIIISGILTLQACGDNKKDYLFTINTRFGDIKMILYDQTPKHKENFINLAKKGFYDSLLFHRVINRFMIQTGDPVTKSSPTHQDPDPAEVGYTIPAEIVPGLLHEKGAVAAARQGDNINPNRESSGSQFYIVQGEVWEENKLKETRINYNELYRYFGNLIERTSFQHVKDTVVLLQNEQKIDALQDLILSMKDTIEQEYDVELDLPLSPLQIQTYTTVGGTPHLDGTYTVFGKVVDGFDVIDKIASVPTGPSDRPLENIFITIEFELLNRKKIEEDYGFKYPEMPSN